VHEGERWQTMAASGEAPRLRELFAPAYRRATASGFLMALVALVTWWSCNAFIPVVAAGLASQATSGEGVRATQMVVEHWKTTITSSFNIGGLIGTLLTVPIARNLGRRWMFGLYFLLSAAAVLLAFGGRMPADLGTWSWLYFGIGVSVFGIFGSFTFYLPELFPTRLRGTGSGFCYNAGRLLTAAGPLLVGSIAARNADSLTGAFGALKLVGFVPLIGVLLLPLVIETRGRNLPD